MRASQCPSSFYTVSYIVSKIVNESFSYCHTQEWCIINVLHTSDDTQDQQWEHDGKISHRRGAKPTYVSTNHVWHAANTWHVSSVLVSLQTYVVGDSPSLSRIMRLLTAWLITMVRLLLPGSAMTRNISVSSAMASLMIGMFAVTDVLFAVKERMMGSDWKSSPPVKGKGGTWWILAVSIMVEVFVSVTCLNVGEECTAVIKVFYQKVMWLTRSATTQYLVWEWWAFESVYICTYMHKCMRLIVSYTITVFCNETLLSLVIIATALLYLSTGQLVVSEDTEKDEWHTQVEWNRQWRIQSCTFFVHLIDLNIHKWDICTYWVTAPTPSTHHIPLRHTQTHKHTYTNTHTHTPHL